MTSARSIRVLADRLVLAPDAPLVVMPVAYAEDGGTIVSYLSSDFTIDPDDASIMRVAASGTALVAGSRAGTTRVLFDLVGNPDIGATMEVINIGPRSGVKRRITVIDASTRLPVPGVRIRFAGMDCLSDERGACEAAIVDAPVDLHVFSDRYDWFSAYGITARDILVVLDPGNRRDVAGARGSSNTSGEVIVDTDMVQHPFSSEFWDYYAQAWPPVGSSRVDAGILNLQVLWPQFKTNLRDGMLMNPGVEGTFGGSERKAGYWLPMQDGSAFIHGIARRYSLDTFDCFHGQDTEWDSRIAAETWKCLDQEAMTTTPEFFYTGWRELTAAPLVPDDGLSQPAPFDSADINGNGYRYDLIPNFSTFTEMGDPVSRVLQDRAFRIAAVPLPEMPGSARSFPGVNILVYHLVPGLGLVTNGSGYLLAGNDAGMWPGDSGVVDAAHAPVSSPVPPVEQLLLVLAGDASLHMPEWFAEEVWPSNVIRWSGVIGRVPSSPEAPVSVPSFLSVPDYHFDQRERTIGVLSEQGSLARVVLQGKDNSIAARRWVVWLPPNMEVTLPEPPDGMADRMMSTPEGAFYTALDLEDGIDLDGLLQFNGQDLCDLPRLLKRFATVVPR